MQCTIMIRYGYEYGCPPSLYLLMMMVCLVFPDKSSRVSRMYFSFGSDDTNAFHRKRFNFIVFTNKCSIYFAMQNRLPQSNMRMKMRGCVWFHILHLHGHFSPFQNYEKIICQTWPDVFLVTFIIVVIHFTSLCKGLPYFDRILNTFHVFFDS